MNVNLPPDLERLVRAKIASGRYDNPSEVVGAALRLLAEHDRQPSAHLQAALTEGLNQANRGELLDGPAVARELRASLRRRRGTTGRTRPDGATTKPPR